MILNQTDGLNSQLFGIRNYSVYNTIRYSLLFGIHYYSVFVTFRYSLLFGIHYYSEFITIRYLLLFGIWNYSVFSIHYYSAFGTIRYSVFITIRYSNWVGQSGQSIERPIWANVLWPYIPWKELVLFFITNKLKTRP